MLKSKEYLSNIAEKCIKKAKTLGATDVEIGISNSIADTINYRNKEKIGRAHVRTPVTEKSRMPSSA